MSQAKHRGFCIATMTAYSRNWVMILVDTDRWYDISYPSEHAGSDPEAFRSWPVMAIMASMQPGLGQILYA